MSHAERLLEENTALRERVSELEKSIELSGTISNYVQETIESAQRKRIAELGNLIERLRYYGYPAFEPFCTTSNEAADELERVNGLVALQKKDMKVAMDRIAELEGAATMLCAVLRTRTWELKHMNACGMEAGDSSDVHALRMMEAALSGQGHEELDNAD
jgi:AICAR transformylase/IMP cyclohydrolase PurH